MKIDVSGLKMGEVSEIAERLGKLNIHTCFSIMGGRALLVAASFPAAPKEEEMVAW